MAVGVALIVTMILVGGSLSRYDTFYGDGGANVVTHDSEIEEVTSAPGEMVITRIDPDDEDGCCGDVPTMDLGVEIPPSLTDNDQ
jgi:hypothetical protein